jgi:hypothetical protein
LSSLKTASTEEIKEELRQRKLKEEREFLEGNQRGQAALRRILSQGVLDFLLPEHDRTSCSDSHRTNGFHSGEVGRPPRCQRCAMLEFMEGYGGDDHIITLSFGIIPVSLR